MTESATQVETLQIRTVPDPVLRQKAKPVRRINRRLKTLLDRMAATMYDADGVGLAGPQVGELLRIAVIDAGDGLIELINPEILERSEEEVLGVEGCLSIPGYIGDVRRARSVRVTALNRDGHQIWLDAEDFLARVIQHELDHLDGILYTDKAERVVEVPPETRLRLVYFGTTDFSVQVLEELLKAGCRPRLVVTPPDRPRGRGQQLRPCPLKAFAEEQGLRVLTPERLDDPDWLAEVRRLRPDVLLAAAYGRVLPPALLEVPRLASLNVHPSLLPRYRGAAPIQRALLAGEAETGVTIQHMAEGLDEGDIVHQQGVPIEPADTAGTLQERLAHLGGELAVKALHDLAVGEAPRIPQDGSRATLAPKIRSEEEWVDWGRSAVDVCNQVRALTPRPGARAAWAGGELRIEAVEVVRGEAGMASPAGGLAGGAAAEPGTVLAAGPEGITVATGSGSVRILRLRPAGRRSMTAAEFLNGHRLEPGTRLAAGSS